MDATLDTLATALRELISDLEDGGLLEAKLSASDRKSLPKSAFAIPPDRYPIHDESHARNALSRASGKPEESRVRSAVCRRYPSMGECKKRKMQEARAAREDAASAGDSRAFYRALNRERKLQAA